MTVSARFPTDPARARIAHVVRLQELARHPCSAAGEPAAACA